MPDQIYIQPLTTVPGPQSVEGDAVRLAGGMVYAREFAVMLRRDGALIDRRIATKSSIEEVLAALPEDMGAEAQRQWSNLRMAHPPLQLGNRTIRLDMPQVMGILNVTPDSFSDGGSFVDGAEAMQTQAAAMHEAGAAIIDIGGESTRPGAKDVWEGEEIKRVQPAIEYCAGMGAAVSVDTRRPAVMEAALGSGAQIINDVSALRYDPRSLQFAAGSGAPVILMHAPGTGENLHADADYGNVVFDVFDFLRGVRDIAIEAGISREKIILDPGIGFGKSLAENLALLNALPLFHALGQPILLGASRKRFVGALSNEAPADQRLGGSLAIAQLGMAAGVQILRVHDVPETVQVRNIWRGLRDAALTDFSMLVE
ncbi:MAG: dihydropteroate synthase [Alteraurantiacibacter sp.]